MTTRHRLPALLAAGLIVGPALQGCVATTVAGAALGVAGTAVKTTAAVTRTVAGATVHVAARVTGHAVKQTASPR